MTQDTFLPNFAGDRARELERWKERARLAEDRLAALSRPIPMVLHCPQCATQHIDAPSPGWDNPPHRSHLCEECGTIWRPADVPTVGVEKIETRGEKDTWPSA